MLNFQQPTTAGLQPVFTAAVQGERFNVHDEYYDLPGKLLVARGWSRAVLWVRNTYATAFMVKVVHSSGTTVHPVQPGTDTIMGTFAPPIEGPYMAVYENGAFVSRGVRNLSEITYLEWGSEQQLASVAGITVALLRL